MLRTLIRPAEIKAADDESERTFEAFLATYDEDLGNDVVHPGAFKKTLSDWKAGGKPIPLVDMHAYMMNSSPSIRHILGKLEDAKEVEKKGLWTKWSVIPGNDGDEALNRLRHGSLRGMSMGYKSVREEFEKVQPDEGHEYVRRHLHEVKLIEGSLVIFGMNEDALVDPSSVKSMLEAYAGKDLDEADVSALVDMKARIEEALAKARVEPEGVAAEDPRRLAMAERRRALARGMAATP